MCGTPEGSGRMGIFDLFSGKKERTVAAGVLYGRELKPYDQKMVGGRWLRIEELATGGKSSQWRQAVIEADKTLDYALTQLCSGASLGERLKAARPLFTADVYQGLWEAHKIRNVLVHDAHYEISTLSCREAVGEIKEGLRELGARLD